MRTLLNTREDWLRACLTRVTAGWPVGADLPENTRISVGFPQKRRGKGGNRAAEHYRPDESEGGFWEIFVSPAMGDALEVARAVAFEAARISTRRAPTAPEIKSLSERAERVVKTLPPYPHSALKVGTTPTATAPGAEVPGPGSRMIRAVCPTCGYSLRTTRKWLAVAVPSCPADPAHGMMRVGGKEKVTP